MIGGAPPAGRRRRRRVALVLWSGDVGGAEVVTLSLAEHMRPLGAEATLVFVEQPQPLATRLAGTDIPYESLDFVRGRDVVRRPRRYAAAVAAAGPDGALLLECGFMGAALRMGGYRAPIVAVEHGAILKAPERGSPRRLPWHLARLGGARAVDVEVAVSDFVLARMRQHPHARTVRRIYNGIDTTRFGAAAPTPARAEGGACVVAFAARLVHGKGHDYLIEAVARLQATHAVQLLIAGEGPERQRLESLARSSGAGAAVRFVGLVHDMPAFWRSADVVAVPSAEFTEACPMTPLEAMACERPVVATINGGLPEIVLDGQTGLLAAAGDPAALAHALSVYAGDAQLRRSHGACGRVRIDRDFRIDACAQSYLDLFEEAFQADSQGTSLSSNSASASLSAR
jgi:glycosyltransferase involved in cell wall biosynthesis